MRILYLFVFVLGLPLLSYGQLNFSVSYNTSLINPTSHQSIIDQFNSDRPWLTREFNELNWLNGYGFGFRYKIDKIAFNVRWENQVDRISASGIDPATDEAFEQTLFFRLSTYSIGLESFFSERFSAHASFDFNRVRYRTELANIDDRIEVLRDWGVGSTFSFGYNFVSEGLMHVSLRPFIHVSWSNHDLTELNTFLNPDINPVDVNVEEEFLNFGLKIIFYNGPW